MTRVVVDASVVLKWFSAVAEPGRDEARALRAEFERGDVDVVVPGLLVLELLNVAARRWCWPADDLVTLAEALSAMPWRVTDPVPVAVARWAAAGLTAYDAAYVAVAEALGCSVVTADEAMLAVAPGLTRALVAG